MARMVIALLVALLLPALARADECDDQARKVINEFLDALKAKDLDGTVKLIDAPWYHDGQRVIRERSELTPIFRTLLEKRDFKGVTYAEKRLLTYETVRERLEANERALLDEVLEKNDRVALLSVTKDGKPQEGVVIFVRVRDGKAHVVGIKE